MATPLRFTISDDLSGIAKAVKEIQTARSNGIPLASEEMRKMERTLTGSDPPVIFYEPMPNGTFEMAESYAAFLRTMPNIADAHAGHTIPLNGFEVGSPKCIGVQGSFYKGDITPAEAATRMAMYRTLWLNTLTGVLDDRAGGP